MDNDNIYPNFGEPFSIAPSKDQKKDVVKRTEETLEQVPLLKEVLNHLDKRITFYDTLDSIEIDIDTDPATFQKIHAANRLTRDNLKAERNYIQARIESVTPR